MFVENFTTKKLVVLHHNYTSLMPISFAVQLFLTAWSLCIKAGRAEERPERLAALHFVELLNEM